MQVFVPAETREGERRVAITPEAAQKLIKLGLTVSVESGAELIQVTMMMSSNLSVHNLYQVLESQAQLQAQMLLQLFGHLRTTASAN